MKWLEPDNMNGWKSMTAGWAANANACGNMLMGMIRKKGKNRKPQFPTTYISFQGQWTQTHLNLVTWMGARWWVGWTANAWEHVDGEVIKVAKETTIPKHITYTS